MNATNSPKPRHPAVGQLLRYFLYSDPTPADLRCDRQDIGEPFDKLALRLADDPRLDGPELTACLRKLLEAKDCAVRAVS